jgi:SAM-dependent methyltransferase
MPTSHFNQISPIVEIMFRLRPTSVLDVGVGYGKYGILAREYLEFGVDYKPFEERRIRIDGIEAFPEYIADGQRFFYDDIHIGNVLEILPGLPMYDLILLVDVLEHFTREEGIRLLTLCSQKAKHVIVSTPLDIGVQGAVFGNEFERHRYQWKKNDMRAFHDVTFFTVYHSLFFVIGQRGLTIKKEMQRTNFRLWLRSFFPSLYRIRPCTGLIKKSVIVGSNIN